MKFLHLKTTDPYYNLAVEEYFFEKSKDDVFILWQNEPSVVIGKNQNAYAELNLNYIKNKKIHIARRITGGGAVYHDLGNVNYSFISTANRDGIDFAYFTEPIISSLSDLGIEASLSGRNDIEIGARKISGNAQYTKNGRTLHHGTLLFDADLTVLDKALYVDEEKIKSKAIKSTRARVINLKSLSSLKTTEEFIDVLISSLISKFSPEIIDAPFDPYITELKLRNKSEEWLFPKCAYLSSYTVKRKKKYDYGLVEAEILMSGDIISNIKIHGDFFGVADIEELEEKIKGRTIAEISAIKNLDIFRYISGMQNDEFITFLENN